jgi:L-ascorbate metabolism protein UlaG (beta-lactamase superfamily)
MPATTTTRHTKKGAEVAAKKAAAAAESPALWQRMTSEWARPEASDRAWLLYSANYLFRTAGVRWTLDPLTLRQRLPSAPKVDASPLVELDYIVLTHRHADHLDLELLRRLRDFPARWVVPGFLLDALRILDLPAEKLLIPRPLQPLQLGALTLTPFEGLHWESAPGYPDGRHGVPAIGYLAEFNGKRWLLPGDTRTYAAAQLPAFGPLDGLFAHLWLGRGKALAEEPPLLDAFCRFCLDLSPRRMIITHLDEFGRDADELWDMLHARKIIRRLQEMNGFANCALARTGDGITL